MRYCVNALKTLAIVMICCITLALPTAVTVLIFGIVLWGMITSVVLGLFLTIMFIYWAGENIDI